MFMGLKDSTLDIDLVFENQKNRQNFKQAVKSLGYSELDSKIIYGARKNLPEILTLGDIRFDLFVNDVIDFIFSDNMKKRARQIRQFKDNLILKIADPHDIILMKCATDRAKDLDDAKTILENLRIDWNLIVEEAKAQLALGKIRAIFELGYFLEKLTELKIKIPKQITDELWNLLEKQAKEHRRESNLN